MDFRQQYKKKTLGFGNADESRILRAEKQAEGRKERRAEDFAKTRDYSTIENSSKFDCKDNAQDSSGVVRNAQMDRRTKLMKWKEERDLRKRLQQRLKKPVFRVGIVHHNLSSPVFKDASHLLELQHSKLCKLVKKQPTPPRRTTRATEKRLAAKLAANSQSKTNTTSVKQTLRSKKRAPRAGTLRDANILSAKKNIITQSFAPENYKFKGPSGLPTLPMFGRAALQDTQINLNSEKVTLQITNEEKDTIASCKQSLHSMSPTVESFTNKVLSPQEAPLYEKKDDKECRDSSMTDNELDCTEEKEVERKAEVETSMKPHAEDVSSASNSSIEAITLRLSSDEPENLDSIDKENILNTTVLLSDDNRKSTVPSQEDTPSTPVFFSPYIVSSRGKSSARKEQQVRLGIGHSPSNEVPTKDTVMKNLNICVEEEERTSQYFKYLLNQEIERLTDLCAKWTEIMSAPDITEDAQYQINQAIGQTNLLMRNKLKRFKELVLDCETGKGQKLVTCRDLQGFWDLIYMDIKNCEFRFGKLEELKSKDWVEEQPTIVKQVVKRRVPVKKQVVSRKQSSIRAMIMAERKKKREQQEEQADSNEIVIKSKKQAAPSSQLGMVEFDGGFFMVSSPKRSINEKSEECTSSVSCSEKKRLSLLRKTHLSEASKNMKSPLTIIKISQMCKTPEVKLDNSIAYINSDQIPGKSILKRTEDDTETESRSVKSLHKVNFNNDVTLNEVSIDEELQNKLDLAVALDKIDNYDTEENALKIHAGKKLNFNDDSFEETESVIREEIENHDNNYVKECKDSRQSLDREESSLAIPVLNIVASTPIPRRDNSDTAHVVRSTNKKTLRRQKHVIDEEKINQNTETLRVLRSQTVNKKDLSDNSSKNFKEEEEDGNKNQKENKSPTKTRRKSSLKTILKEDSSPEKEESNTPKGRRKSAKARLSNVAEQPDQDLSRKRRSTRKSVRFTGEDCSICIENKPVQPMTPHVRRKKSVQSRVSLLGESNTEFVAPLSNGDLISWDSPSHTPMRVRRSHRIAHNSSKQ